MAFSVRFINLPTEQVGERLDLDGCTFYNIKPDGTLKRFVMPSSRWRREWRSWG